MIGWRRIKLGDISDMCLGKMLDQEKNKGEFQPYLANINVRWGSFELTNLNMMRFEESEQDRYGLKYGDIVICEGGEPGRCAIWKEELSKMKFQKALHRVRIRENFSNEFVYYRFLLAGRNGELKNYFIGSTIKHLTGIALKEVEFEYPSFKEQQNLVSVLSALDSKIELNNRINCELEAMAKTLFDYWFVQFDFPDQHGRPYRSSGGEMIWNSELKREIPDGWEARKMSDWIAADKSGDWGKESIEGKFTKKVICIRGADINGLNGLEELNPPTRFILEKNAHKILNSHDLIIEISGGSPTQSTGRLAYITDATLERFKNPLICSNFCKAISLKEKKLLYNFAYYWNSLYENDTFFGYEGKTSGIKNLLFDSFVNSYWTVVPADEVVEKFYSFMNNIQVKRQTALDENQQLAELRDWLLPMLMNGQVTVPERALHGPNQKAIHSGRF